MIICLDFDGVLAATDASKRAWVLREEGIDLQGLNMCRSQIEPIIGSAAYTVMQSNVGFEDTLLAPPICESVDVIRRISEDAFLYIVTARAPEKVCWISEWLEATGIHGDIRGVYSSHLITKGAIAAYLGAKWLVDNDIRHLRGLPCEVGGILFGEVTSPVADTLLARDWAELERIFAA